MEDHPWKRTGKTANWRERADRIKKERVQRAILNGTLTIRYVDRGADPYKDNGRREHMVERITEGETWAERTLREAQEQKPRLLDLLERTQQEYAAIEAIEKALEGLSGATSEELTSPLAPPVTPPTPKVRDTADISDDEVIRAIQLLGNATGGWVSSGPVKRELKNEDPNFSQKKIVPLLNTSVLEKKGSGPQTMYRVKVQKTPESPPPPPLEPPPKAKKAPASTEDKRTLQHPGVEAMPEHLRGMPVADQNFPLKSRIKTAEGQLAVYQDLQENSPAVRAEVAKRLKIPGTRAKDYLDALESAGLIEATGVWRRAEGQGAGRTSKEFSAIGAGSPKVEEELEASEEESVSALEETPAITQQDHPTLEEVRDAIAKQGDTFSPGNIAKMNEEWSLEVVIKRLDALAELGIAERIQIVDDVVVYNYIEPSGPGAAALIDQARASEETQHGPGSQPVPGTAKQAVPSNKEAAETVRTVRRAGLEANAVASGHWSISNPATGERMLIAGTPSNPKTIESDRKRLRRKFNIHI